MKKQEIESIIRQIVRKDTSDQDIDRITNMFMNVNTKLNDLFARYVDEKYSFTLGVYEKEKIDEIRNTETTH